MKRSVFITSLMFICAGFSPLSASTNVPSAINTDTQWDSMGNPYVIQGKVTVAKGATLEVGPAVQVVFQAGAILEVDGVLKVKGAGTGRTVFNMTDGGMQSQLFVNEGSAFIYNARILGGVLLARDSKFRMEGSEVTKGSGVYLQGTTSAYLNNNPIYGNATGIVLDGKVKLYGQFNTLVQNTYGLYVKGYSFLKFRNNSIHDNQEEVVNNTPSFNLGYNYWGTTDSPSIHAKIQGQMDLTPVKTLKDVLRVYVRTQLPAITAKMANALAAKEKRQDKEDALALKKFNEMKQSLQAQNATPGTAQAATSVPAPATAQAPPAPGSEAAMTAPPVPGAAPAVTGSEVSAPPIASGEAAPPALPGMGNPPVVSQAVSGASTSPAPSAEGAPPPLPGMENGAPPAMPAENPPTVSTPPSSETTTASSVPVPPEVSGQAPALPPGTETTALPPPLPGAGNEIIPPPPDLNEQIAAAPPAPPTVTGQENQPPSTMPPVPAVSTAQAASSSPGVPTGSNPLVPPMPAGSSAQSSAMPAAPSIPEESNPSMPPVPAVSSTGNTAAQNQPIPTPIPPAEETTDQAKTLKALQGVNGDIDGMQAPPLEVNPDLSNPSSSSSTTTSTNNQKKAAPNTLDLPPLQDSDVVPPKDLDLPPTDDLGNINLNSPSK